MNMPADDIATRNVSNATTISMENMKDKPHNKEQVHVEALSHDHTYNHLNFGFIAVQRIPDVIQQIDRKLLQFLCYKF